jgi:CRISPR-associated protein Csx10
MNSLTIHLQLQSALLISQLGGGDPNSSIGYAYIPGSTVRGALISRYLNGKREDAGEPTFRRLFLSGAVRFLNGYPLTSDGRRTLPAPRSWQQPKDAAKGSLVYDWAISKPQEQNQPWKSLGEGLFCATGGTVDERVKPATQINIHIAREDRQRPTAGQAAIFRYDALAEGQTFAAMIVADDPADLALLQTKLPDGARLPLGRSRNAGYGWVQVSYPAANVCEPATEWYAAPLPNPMPSPPVRLIVTLLSDTLIQDPATGAYCADLQPYLGVAAAESFVRLHTVGGFNRKWNLPLPQAEAIAAGSVFVYDYCADLAAKLIQYSESGIGGRRVEGFGRIAINWQQQPTLTLIDPQKMAPHKPTEAGQTDKAQAQPPEPIALNEGRTLAEQMVNRMLRAELDRLLLQAINTNPIDRRGLRNAQLSRVRVVARHALERQHLAKAVQANRISRLADFLLNVKESARNQLQRARIPRPPSDDQPTGSEPYYDWLTQLAVVPQTIWPILGVPDRLPTIGQCTAQLTTALAIEYALRLIDGIAQVATREATHE